MSSARGDERRKALGGDVLDVAHAAVELRDELGNDVDDEERAARLREVTRERMPTYPAPITATSKGSLIRRQGLATTRSAA